MQPVLTQEKEVQVERVELFREARQVVALPDVHEQRHLQRSFVAVENVTEGKTTWAMCKSQDIQFFRIDLQDEVQPLCLLKKEQYAQAGRQTLRSVTQWNSVLQI